MKNYFNAYLPIFSIKSSLTFVKHTLRVTNEGLSEVLVRKRAHKELEKIIG